MPLIEFIVYGSVHQKSGGYYYDRELIQVLKHHGFGVSVTTPADSGGSKTDLYIIDELCHPDFFRKRHFRRLQPSVPVVGMVHHLAADENLPPALLLKHLLMERKFFSALNFAVFNSRSTESSARGKGGYRGPSLVCVPGRSSAGETKNNGEAPLSLLFLGNLIPRKGLHYLLAAMAMLPDIPCTLTIAGSDTVNPAYTRKIRLLIQRYGLEERTAMIGFAEDDEKERLLKKADLMIMPSFHEGYGIAYIEAMGYGVIPIAGISGGAGEIIRHEENGFLLKPERCGELADIIRRIYHNPDWKRCLSEQAYKSWFSHPPWEVTFQPLISALEELI
ncbi:MAG: hypothetical protein B0D92_07400 [Spirochaeta sp. LUC14_002_19_P3]|nr:MAG: hypothetical protein B0D92_07400 [Spirochaeta sp. LUC14_002_19_P3]